MHVFCQIFNSDLIRDFRAGGVGGVFWSLCLLGSSTLSQHTIGRTILSKKKCIIDPYWRSYCKDFALVACCLLASSNRTMPCPNNQSPVPRPHPTPWNLQGTSLAERTSADHGFWMFMTDGFSALDRYVRVCSCPAVTSKSYEAGRGRGPCHMSTRGYVEKGQTSILTNLCWWYMMIL